MQLTGYLDSTAQNIRHFLDKITFVKVETLEVNAVECLYYH